MKESSIIGKEGIRSKIHAIRGQQVMLDADLAELYGVPTKVLNQAVKRNIERFPENFMFKINRQEEENLRCQNGTSNELDSLRSQIVTLERTEQTLRSQNATLNTKKGKHRKYLPYAFTEQGVAMLSAVLKSNTAVKVSIQIIEAFVAMRKLISQNAQIFQRLDRVEIKQIEYDEKFETIFKAIESKEPIKNQGVFFDGQVFDAHKLVSDIIRSAKKSIIVIDNYIDDSVLTLFNKRKDDVNVIIYTKNISKQLKQDIEKYNSQYKPLELKEFKYSHDRFLIIDNNEVYHMGASLKDLGKKWFAFSRIDKEAISIIDRL